MISRQQTNSLWKVLIILAFFKGSESAFKLRSWLGPQSFVEGPVPTSRYGHGVVGIEDKLYVFGGYDGNGRNSPPV
jgi:hypothetical protein